MKTTLILAMLLCAVVACSGPVHVAKSDNEGIKSIYEDPKLSDLSQKYQPVLKDIYQRYQTAGIDIYPKGIGFTSLVDQDGKKHYYLLVQVRPRNIMFGEVQTKPHDRFIEVYKRYFENNLRLMKAGDLRDGIRRSCIRRLLARPRPLTMRHLRRLPGIYYNLLPEA